MTTSFASEESVDVDVSKAVRMAIAATEKKDYVTALTLFNHVYGNPALGRPADGLSYFGLCVAIAEKQTKKGIELCQEAIEKQFYDARHHANLVRLHIAKGKRRHAVRAMEEALRSLPSDERLLKLRKEMGYRTRNVVPFLSREHALNRALGVRKRGAGTRESEKVRSSASGPGNNLRNLHPLQMVLFRALRFATVFGITFYILYQHVYG